VLILTTEKTGLFDPGPDFAAWPGPACLCLLPGHGLGAGDISRAEERFLVFDFLPGPPSGLVLLRAVTGQVSRRAALPDGPLLFAAGDPDRVVFEGSGAAAAADPLVIEYGLNPDTGALDRLLLGSGIMGNPLLLTFFANMQAELEEPYAADSLALLKEHLVQR